MGLLGLLVCAICGIFAWVMGKEDMKKIDAGIIDPSARGNTQAGMILGMVTTILLILSLLLLAILAASGAALVS